MSPPAVSEPLSKRPDDATPALLEAGLATSALLTLISATLAVAGLRTPVFAPVTLALAGLTAALALVNIPRQNRERAATGRAFDSVAARLGALLDSAMDAIITVDEQQRIVLYNQAAERIFGWRQADVVGQPLDLLIPLRFRGGHANHVRAFGDTGTTSRRMGDNTVLHGVRSNGEEFPMEASISQLAAPEGKLYTVILRDITERMAAQEELSAFAAEAQSIREGEKARVARELHDELAQSLTALKMDTQWVRERVVADPRAAEAKLETMQGMLDQTVAATRRIAADLRPLLLDDLGLNAAIEWLVNAFMQRHGIECELSLDDDLDLREPYATAVFRIVQEALANVAKHAQARQVQIAMVRTPQEVILEVRDDGRGFSTSAPRKPNSLGLMGLRERAQLLKGSLSVDSKPGEGTRIRVRIPLGARQGAA